ncbi:MAG: hypothetical protein ACYTEQ_22755 [Planctomycetota bacterium]|jgi:hypothetical protein
MAKLPETYEEETIIGMLPGDVGYTVPWAMWADKERELWVNGNYTIDSKPGGPGRTTNMRIERTKIGVIVYQSTIGDYKYSVGERGWDHSPNKLPVELV